MPTDMSSKKTTLWLALFFGLCNALSKYLLGYATDSMMYYFLVGAIGGTIFVLAVVWVALAILGKWHLHFMVSNWMLLIVGCLGVLRSLLM